MHTQTMYLHLLIRPNKHTHWNQSTKDFLIFSMQSKGLNLITRKHRRGSTDGSQTCVELKLLIRLDPDVAMRRLLILYITIIFLLRWRRALREGSVYHEGGRKRVKLEWEWWAAWEGSGVGGGGCWVWVIGWRSAVDAEVMWSNGR